MARYLRRVGHEIGRRRARRLMAKMGLTPIYERPHERSTPAAPGLSIFFVRSWDRAVQPGPVRQCDIHPDAVRIPLFGGDHGLGDPQGAGLRLSSTMDAGFCVTALEEALARFGKPEIFNTDQGSQFTWQVFTSVLHDAEVRISMPGTVDEQCLHRAALALPEVRVRQSPCLRDRLRVGSQPWPMDHLLQHPAPALGPDRANPGRGLPADRTIRSWGHALHDLMTKQAA